MDAYVINLDHRKDRWETVQRKLSPYFNLIRHPATPNDCGWKGLILSYKELFEKVDHDVLVFEDDVSFVQDPAGLKSVIDQLPSDFDMLILGGIIHNNRLEYFSPNLIRTYGTLTTHAVYYSKSFIKSLDFTEIDNHIDLYFIDKIHSRGNTYISSPFFCYQEASVSDILRRKADMTRSMQDSDSRVQGVTRMNAF